LRGNRLDVIPYYSANAHSQRGSWLLDAVKASIAKKAKFREVHLYGSPKGNGFQADTSDLRYLYDAIRWQLHQLHESTNEISDALKTKRRKTVFMEDLSNNDPDAQSVVIGCMNSLDALVRSNYLLRKNEGLFQGKATKVIEQAFESMQSLFSKTSKLLRDIFKNYRSEFSLGDLKQSFLFCTSQAFKHLDLKEQVESSYKMISRFEDILIKH